MNVFRDRAIATKVSFAFAVVLLIVLLLGGTAVNRLGAVNDRAADVRDNWLPSLGVNGQMVDAIKEYRVIEARTLIRGFGPTYEDNVATLQKVAARVVKARADYAPMIVVGTDDEKFIHEFDAAWASYIKTSAHVIDLVRAGDNAAVSAAYFGEDRAAFDATAEAITKDAAFNVQEGKRSADEGEAIYKSTRVVIFTAIAAAFLLCMGLGLAIIRSIAHPIKEMTGVMGRLAADDLAATVTGLDRKDEIGQMAGAVQVFKQNAIDKKRMEAEQRAADEATRNAEQAQRQRESAIVAEVAEVAKAASTGDLDRRIDLSGKDGFLLTLCEGVNNLVHLTGLALKDVASVLGAVAQGDLTRRITSAYDGVFGQLKGDVNTTADKLFEIVTNINKAGVQIGSAAAEVASGSLDLSQRSEEQASALEETAASMEELASTVRQNASNAQQANQLAAGAREVAASGGQVVSEAINAMSRIESSSQKIGDIVGMIDEIAFQTNLLALNAAVEAARAGDAGKGFAVVAQEVRNLAQRSAQASKEIKGLINESTSQVKTGAELVNGAGKTLNDILTSIKRVADIVADIAAASQEQASGIDQVNGAISQMDEMTQQNAALVEESAAAGHALEEQSRELNRLMGFFHTGR